MEKNRKSKLSRLCTKSSTKILASKQPESSQISKYFIRNSDSTSSTNKENGKESPDVRTRNQKERMAALLKEDENEFGEREPPQIFNDSEFDLKVKKKDVSTKKSKSTVVKTQNKPRKNNKRIDKKQPRIENSMKKHSSYDEKYTKILNDQILADGVDPEHLQMAIALSRSISEPCNVVDNSEYPDTQQRIHNIKITLEQFGFKNSKTASSDNNVILKEKLSKIRARSVLLRRTQEDRDKIIAKKVGNILNNAEDDKENGPAQKFTIVGDFLHNLISNDSIYDNHKLISSAGLSAFYTNLVKIDFSDVGVLLKNWDDIPGRDRSPDSKYGGQSEKNIINHKKSPINKHDTSKNSFSNYSIVVKDKNRVILDTSITDKSFEITIPDVNMVQENDKIICSDGYKNSNKTYFGNKSSDINVKSDRIINKVGDDNFVLRNNCNELKTTDNHDQLKILKNRSVSPNLFEDSDDSDEIIDSSLVENNIMKCKTVISKNEQRLMDTNDDNKVSDTDSVSSNDSMYIRANINVNYEPTKFNNKSINETIVRYFNDIENFDKQIVPEMDEMNSDIPNLSDFSDDSIVVCDTSPSTSKNAKEKSPKKLDYNKFNKTVLKCKKLNKHKSDPLFKNYIGGMNKIRKLQSKAKSVSQMEKEFLENLSDDSLDGKSTNILKYPAQRKLKVTINKTERSICDEKSFGRVVNKKRMSACRNIFKKKSIDPNLQIPQCDIDISNDDTDINVTRISVKNFYGKKSSDRLSRASECGLNFCQDVFRHLRSKREPENNLTLDKEILVDLTIQSDNESKKKSSSDSSLSKSLDENHKYNKNQNKLSMRVGSTKDVAKKFNGSNNGDILEEAFDQTPKISKEDEIETDKNRPTKANRYSLRQNMLEQPSSPRNQNDNKVSLSGLQQSTPKNMHDFNTSHKISPISRNERDKNGHSNSILYNNETYSTQQIYLEDNICIISENFDDKIDSSQKKKYETEKNSPSIKKRNRLIMSDDGDTNIIEKFDENVIYNQRHQISRTVSDKIKGRSSYKKFSSVQNDTMDNNITIIPTLSSHKLKRKYPTSPKDIDEQNIDLYPEIICIDFPTYDSDEQTQKRSSKTKKLADYTQISSAKLNNGKKSGSISSFSDEDDTPLKQLNVSKKSYRDTIKKIFSTSTDENDLLVKDLSYLKHSGSSKINRTHDETCNSSLVTNENYLENILHDDNVEKKQNKSVEKVKSEIHNGIIDTDSKKDSHDTGEENIVILDSDDDVDFVDRVVSTPEKHQTTIKPEICSPQIDNFNKKKDLSNNDEQTDSSPNKSQRDLQNTSQTSSDDSILIISDEELNYSLSTQNDMKFDRKSSNRYFTKSPAFEESTVTASGSNLLDNNSQSTEIDTKLVLDPKTPVRNFTNSPVIEGSVIAANSSKLPDENVEYNSYSSYDEMLNYFPLESEEIVKTPVIDKKDSQLSTRRIQNSSDIEKFRADKTLSVSLENILESPKYEKYLHSVVKPKPRRLTQVKEMSFRANRDNASKSPTSQDNVIELDIDSEYNQLCEEVSRSFVRKEVTKTDSVTRTPPNRITRDRLISSPNTPTVLVIPDDCPYEIRKQNVTPKPDFERMDSPERLELLDKYGIKPLKRKQAIAMLEYVYDQTHPIGQITPEKTNKRRKISGCEPDVDLAKVRLEENDVRENGEEFMQKLEPANFTPEKQGEEYFLPTRTKSKYLGCPVPLHVSFFNLISSRDDLRKQMLLYEPIDLDQIHLELKQQGYRYDPKDLLSFMDKRCITVKTKNRVRKGRTAASQRKGKKIKESAVSMESVDDDFMLATQSSMNNENINNCAEDWNHEKRFGPIEISDSE